MEERETRLKNFGMKNPGSPDQLVRCWSGFIPQQYPLRDQANL